LRERGRGAGAERRPLLGDGTAERACILLLGLEGGLQGGSVRDRERERGSLESPHLSCLSNG